MSEDTQQPHSSIPQGVRYSLKEIMEEVAIDRRDSALGRELVDATEINKMFGKQVRKKKKKKGV